MNNLQQQDICVGDEFDLDIELDVRTVTYSAPENASTDEPPYTLVICHSLYETYCHTCHRC